MLVAAVSLIFERRGQANYLPVLMLWAGSAGLYLAAFAQGRSWSFDWRKLWQRYWVEALYLGLATLGAAALRFYKLGAIPRVINGDEGLLGQAALLTKQLPLANPFALFENFGALYLQTINVAFSLWGQTPFALRLLPAIGGVLAIPAIYLLARRLFGPRVAILAACLLAVSHMHMQFSRTVAVGYIQGTFLIPLELYFFLSGLENRSALRMALGGLILGLHFSIYLSAQIAAGLLLVYLVAATVLCWALIQKALRQILVFWLGVGVAALPGAVYAWRHPAEFFARLNVDGTFQSGWLARQMAETGQSAVQLLAGRVAHAFLSLIYYPSIDFYGAPVPDLTLLAGTLFLLGLGYVLWRWRDPRYLLLNGYFWGVTVAVGIFSAPPSADSYRMLIALPAALLIAAIGLDRLLEVFTLNEPVRRAARAVVVVGVLAAALILNTRTYFVDFAGQCRYGGDPQTRFASYLGNYLGQLDREADVYLLSDDVFRYGTHSSVDFLSRNLAVTNVPEPAATLNPSAHSVIVAPASRADELKQWANDHPGGNLHREYDCDKLMLLAYQFQ